MIGHVDHEQAPLSQQHTPQMLSAHRRSAPARTATGAPRRERRAQRAATACRRSAELHRRDGETVGRSHRRQEHGDNPVTEPFWARGRIPASRDIALLRPATLPKGKRFETEADARKLSVRTAGVLRGSSNAALRLRAPFLDDCRAGYAPCAPSLISRWPQCYNTLSTKQAVDGSNSSILVDFSSFHRISRGQMSKSKCRFLRPP